MMDDLIRRNGIIVVQPEYDPEETTKQIADALTQAGFHVYLMPQGEVIVAEDFFDRGNASLSAPRLAHIMLQLGRQQGRAEAVHILSREDAEPFLAATGIGDDSGLFFDAAKLHEFLHTRDVDRSLIEKLGNDWWTNRGILSCRDAHIAQLERELAETKQELNRLQKQHEQSSTCADVRQNVHERIPPPAGS